MKHYKKFLSDIGIVSISEVLIAVQFFIFLPILTRFLGPEGYGVWSQIKLTLAFITPFAGLGITASMTRFMTGLKDKDKFNKMFSSFFFLTLGVSILFSIVFMLLSKPLSIFLTGSIENAYLFIFAGILFLLNLTYSAFVVIFTLYQNFYKKSIFSVIRVSLEILLILFFILNGFGIMGILIGYIIVKIVLFFAAMLVSRKQLTFVKPSFKKIKPYFKFGLPLTIVPAMEWIFQVGDQYILNYFFGVTIVGLYAVPYSLGFILKKFSSSLFLVLYPRLISYWNNDEKNLFWKYFNYSYKYTFIILIPATVGLCILSKLMIKLFAGAEFVESSGVLLFIAVGMAFFMLWKFVVILLKLKNKTKIVRNGYVSFAILNIVLNLILIPKYSMMGAAYATFITFFFSLLLSIYILLSNKVDLQVWIIFKSIFASLVMGLILYMIRPLINTGLVTRIIILVGVGMITYAGFAFLLRIVTFNELKTLKKILFNKKKY